MDFIWYFLIDPVLDVVFWRWMNDRESSHIFRKPKSRKRKTKR